VSILDQAQKLVASGRGADAVTLVRSAAEAEDPEAMFAVANWRIFALHGGRDLAEAHRLLDRARAKGHADSARLKAALVGNGTGCTADPAEAQRLLEEIRDSDAQADAQLRFAERMRSEAEARELPSETLSEKPLVRVVRGLLDRNECDYLIKAAEPHMQPSFVIDPRTGGRMPHPVRTSTGMSFGPTLEDLVVNRINRRIAAVTGTDASWGEPLHMLRYAPGQEYKPHLDAIPGVENQRHWTALIYLNEGYDGGATRFDLASVEFRGTAGDALIFRNVDGDGDADPRARHAGRPVTQGVKWLATRWIRKAPYHPWEA
jgi:prolyl 4-hydroxylase